MSSLRFAEDAKRLLALLTPPATIIDGQIGHGQYSEHFRALGFEVIGFEHVSQLEETLIPHRTIAAIWLADSCQDIESTVLTTRLRLCADWLIVGSYLALILRAGEGIKRVNSQITYLYQPEQAEVILQSAGFKPLTAWLEGPLERQYIHIIAQRL